MENTHYQVDIAIVGGGIAGLWTLNRLRQEGFNAVLLDHDALGAGQTIHAQGIIHGGIKYALTGKLSGSAQAIAAMPQVWQDCLQGRGIIDLRQTRILSPYHYLWSNGELRSRITNFLASKALSSHSEAIPRSAYPALFQHPKFQGRVYRVAETVLDVPSLLKNLATYYPSAIFTQTAVTAEFTAQGHVAALHCQHPQQTFSLQAQQYIFCAGAGNARLLSNPIADAPAMQTRPLHMVLVKHPQHRPVFAHCISHHSQPRITITTHQTTAGDSVWYLGGRLAEQGVNRSSPAQIALAQQELAELFPWLDFATSDWHSFMIDRAEPQQAAGERPNASFARQQQNFITAWPTKLAFAPKLAEDILQQLRQLAICPQWSASVPNPDLAPSITATPWDNAFNTLQDVHSCN